MYIHVYIVYIYIYILCSFCGSSGSSKALTIQGRLWEPETDLGSGESWLQSDDGGVDFLTLQGPKLPKKPLRKAKRVLNGSKALHLNIPHLKPFEQIDFGVGGRAQATRETSMLA